jgi:hypothetical protein
MKKNKKASKVSRPREEEGNLNDQVIHVDVEETQPRKRSDGIKKVHACDIEFCLHAHNNYSL